MWERLKNVSLTYVYITFYPDADPKQSAFHAASSHQTDNKTEITGIDAVTGPTGKKLVATTSLDGVVNLWELTADSDLRCTLTVGLDAGNGLRSVRISGDGAQIQTFSFRGGNVWVAQLVRHWTTFEFHVASLQYHL